MVSDVTWILKAPGVFFTRFLSTLVMIALIVISSPAFSARSSNANNHSGQNAKTSQHQKKTSDRAYQQRAHKIANREFAKSGKFFAKRFSKGRWTKNGALIFGGITFAILATAVLGFGAVAMAYVAAYSPFLSVLTGVNTAVGATTAVGLATSGGLGMAALYGIKHALVGAAGGFAIAGGNNLIRRIRVKKWADEIELELRENDKAKKATEPTESK